MKVLVVCDTAGNPTSVAIVGPEADVSLVPEDGCTVHRLDLDDGELTEEDIVGPATEDSQRRVAEVIGRHLQAQAD